MAVRSFSAVVFIFLLSLGAGGQEILRGAFDVDLEPVYALEPGIPYPLDQATAHRRALEEAARVFAGMVYGWNFDYALGDRARGIAESFELEPLGKIPFGDTRLSVTDAGAEGSFLRVWAEYRLDEAQMRAFTVVREVAARYSQGLGAAALSRGSTAKAEALADAARAAVRALVSAAERNKPKEAAGTVTLVDVPRYWIDAGRFVCAARFRINVKETIPYRFF
jgi:hypothetical protein